MRVRACVRACACVCVLGPEHVAEPARHGRGEALLRPHGQGVRRRRHAGIHAYIQIYIYIYIYIYIEFFIDDSLSLDSSLTLSPTAKECADSAMQAIYIYIIDVK
jgi:hypothetical protein